jgi:hypothetical protein
MVGQLNTRIQISAKMAIETRKLNMTRIPSELIPNVPKASSFSERPQTMATRVERPIKIKAPSIALPCR